MLDGSRFVHRWKNSSLVCSRGFVTGFLGDIDPWLYKDTFAYPPNRQIPWISSAFIFFHLSLQSDERRMLNFTVISFDAADSNRDR